MYYTNTHTDTWKGTGRRVAPADNQFRCESVCYSEKMSKRRREASRRASALHGTRSASSTGSGDWSAPLPVEDPVQKACTAEEWCAASFCAGVQRLQHRRGKVRGRARRRSQRARCARSVSQVNMRVARHALIHDSLTHHTAWTA